MVSALASSSVKLPRNVSVKLFVSDCDLLRNEDEDGLATRRGKSYSGKQSHV